MKGHYRRMFENKGHRPWWSIAHSEILGRPFKELTGFSYKKTIFVVTPEMTNEAYFEVEEMEKAMEYFEKFYKNEDRTNTLLATVKNGLETARQTEEWAWKQDWQIRSTEELLSAIERLWEVVLPTFSSMFVSQPQHVISLEKRLLASIGDVENSEDILKEATHFKGEMPWDKERHEMREYHRKWSTLSTEEKSAILEHFVTTYGWINNVEGNIPFDKSHYEKQIESFIEDVVYQPSGLAIPEDVSQIGRLVGELGYLRFWSRWHFMHLRYHIKMIVREIIERSEQPDLEFATIDEMRACLISKVIDWNEIRRRKQGYVCILIDENAKIFTGEKKQRYIDQCEEVSENIDRIEGRTANKGKVSGKVRLVSFNAQNYNEEVDAFQNGEILVTGMTRPQIVHLCKKAAAIVTDEGGITSHAAVVSREFGIPCIIATHNATRILKTGDFVEVDADQGIVTRIAQ